MHFLFLFFYGSACTLHYSIYRAMHFSAKRGLAIACRPSVCLSVTLVDCTVITYRSEISETNCTDY